MKKKIIASFLFLFLLFVAGIAITLHVINKTTVNLTALLTLHKVEVIRQDLVISVQTVQSNLYTTGTSFGKELDIIADNVLKLRYRSRTCTDCHHEPEVEKEIRHLLELTKQYEEALSLFITSTADTERIARLQTLAAEIGETIIERSLWMTATANEALRLKTTAAMQRVADSKKILILTLILSFFVGIAISVDFIRSVTRPVTALLSACRQMKSGNLQYRIEEKLQHEFGELAASFNDMAVSLKDQCFKLQEAERLAMVGQLAAGLVHEIKNPLAGIKVSMEVLSAELEMAEEDREVMLRVVNEVNRIEGLLRNLLDYARPPKPEFFPCDLKQVLDVSIKNAELSLKSPQYAKQKDKSIVFVRELGEALPMVMADSSKLLQVFLNLLLNAIEASPEGGTITVRAGLVDGGGGLRIEIADTGKGLDPDTLARIFQPFFTTKPKGSGLGLAISKRLIEQHHGTIAAVSASGQGTTFTITLPLEQNSEQDKA